MITKDKLHKRLGHPFSETPNFSAKGDACVGKSALTQVFHSGGPTYPKNYLMVSTIYVADRYCAKSLENSQFFINAQLLSIFRP